MFTLLGWVAIIFFFGIIIRSWFEEKKEKKARLNSRNSEIQRDSKKLPPQESIQWAAQQVNNYQREGYEDWFKGFKPKMDKSISTQKSAILSSNIDHLVDWYESLIKESNKHIRMHNKFLIYYNDIKKLQELFDQFSDYSIDSNYRDDVTLYLLKLRSSIDNKLYLLVGYTNEDNVGVVFQDNPLLDCEEILYSEPLKENLAKPLISLLIDKYGPKKALDEYSQFDGYEQIITMKSWSQALKTIDEVSANQSQLMKRDFYTKQYYLKDLLEEFNSFSFNNVHRAFYLNAYSRMEIIDLLYEKYYLPQSLLIKNKKNEIKSDLYDISNMGHHAWKVHVIEIMEKYIKDKYLHGYNRGGLSEEYLIYFDDDYPLSIGFLYDDANDTNIFNYTKLKDYSKKYRPENLASIKVKNEFL